MPKYLLGQQRNKIKNKKLPDLVWPMSERDSPIENHSKRKRKEKKKGRKEKGKRNKEKKKKEERKTKKELFYFKFLF